MDRNARYGKFFDDVRRHLHVVSPEIASDTTPRKGNWNVFSKLAPYVWYGVGFTRDRLLRVDLHIKCKSLGETQAMFDALQDRREIIERGVALSLTEIKDLEWEDLGETQAARIAIYRPGFIMHDDDYLKELRVFSVSALVALHDATASRVLEAIGS